MPGRPRAPTAIGPAIVEESPPIAALFKRAQEGIERQDWKLVIDSLQRIIDDPQGALLERQEGLYESARRSAQRTLANLPPEGLTAYRILYDGVAKGLFDHGAAEHDASALQTVVDRYLLSRYGAKAGDLLASWHLDAGRGSDALAVLKQLDLCPTTALAELPPGALAAKQAVALSLLGHADAAQKIASELAAPALANSVLSLVDQLSAPSGQPSLVRRQAPGGDEWPMLGGAPDRRNLMPAVRPALIGDLPWRVPLPGSTEEVWSGVAIQQNEDMHELPVFYAVTSGGRLFVKGPDGCMALDLEGFDVLWQSEPPPQTRTTRPSERSSGGGVVVMPNAGLPSELEERVFRDTIGGLISVAGDLVLTVEGNAPTSELTGEQVVVWGAGGQFRVQPGQQRVVFGNNFGNNFGVEVIQRLVAREVATGKLRWQRGAPAMDPAAATVDPLAVAIFRGTPVLANGSVLSSERSELRTPVLGRVGLTTHHVPLTNSELWAPYMVGDDLYVAALDPADGRMLRRVLLCTLPNSGVNYTDALLPALADRTLYVPTGEGIFFAVDTDEPNGGLLWAARYPQSPSTGRTGNPEWLSSPPIVVGPLVLLAPTDSDQLLAFDRASGEMRWSTPRRTHHYLIGADNESVYLGGVTVARVALQDGKYLWTDRFGTAVGRAALSAKTIYLPTTEGLVAIDAGSGKPVNLGPPDDSLTSAGAEAGLRPTLGNLLCAAGAMFSVDAREVRKFPDLEQSYPKTLAEHRANPGDARLSERLAWMELFRGQPRQAYEALERIALPETRPAEPGELPLRPALSVDERRAERIAHLRVEALLAMARDKALSGDQTIAYVRRAASAARSAADLFKTHYSLGELLARGGYSDEAYTVLVDLQTSDLAHMVVPCWESGELMSPVAPGPSAPAGVERPARQVVGDLLRTVAAKLDAQRQRDLLAQTRLEVMQAVQVLADPQMADRYVTATAATGPSPITAALATLRRVANADVGEGVRQMALIALGRHEAARGKCEAAEQYFAEALRSSGPPEPTAEAAAALADLYLSPQQKLYAPAADLLMMLSRRFAGLSGAIPALPVGAVHPTGETPRLSVDQWVPARQARIDAAALAVQRAALMPEGGTLREQEVWKQHLGDDTHMPRLIHIARHARPAASKATDALSLMSPAAVRPAALADRFVVYMAPNEIQAYSVTDGRQQWAAELRLPDEFGQASPVQNPSAPGALAPADTAYGVVDGQTMIVSTDKGLHAVGLISGKRLWAKPYKSFPADAKRLMRADLLAASDGMVACLLQPRRLSVLRTLDGSVVWERELDNKAVAFVQMFGDYVTTLDALYQTVRIYRRSDGYAAGVLAFWQPDEDSYIAPVATHTADGRLLFCGPRSDEVVAYQAPDGKEQWRSKPPATGKLNITSLFKAGAGKIGVAYEGYGIRILDAQSGGEVASVAIKEYRDEPVDAAREGDLLMVSWTTRTAKGDRAALLAIDLATQTVLWRWTDLNIVLLTSEQLEQVRGVVPLVVEGARAEVPLGGGQAFDIVLVDKRSGRPSGRPVALIRKGTTAADQQRLPIANRISDVFIWPGVMVLGTTREIFSLATENLN